MHPYVLQGQNLNLALTKTDYHVLVGTEECTVQWVDTNKLTCKPPAASEEGVGNSPKVTVSTKIRKLKKMSEHNISVNKMMFSR